MTLTSVIFRKHANYTEKKSYHRNFTRDKRSHSFQQQYLYCWNISMNIWIYTYTYTHAQTVLIPINQVKLAGCPIDSHFPIIFTLSMFQHGQQQKKPDGRTRWAGSVERRMRYENALYKFTFDIDIWHWHVHGTGQNSSCYPRHNPTSLLSGVPFV